MKDIIDALRSLGKKKKKKGLDIEILEIVPMKQSSHGYEDEMDDEEDEDEDKFARLPEVLRKMIEKKMKHKE